MLSRCVCRSVMLLLLLIYNYNKFNYRSQIAVDSTFKYQEVARAPGLQKTHTPTTDRQFEFEIAGSRLSGDARVYKMV